VLYVFHIYLGKKIPIEMGIEVSECYWVS